MADNIKVVVRVRPLVQREINENKGICWTTNGPTIQSADGLNSYVFDHVFNNQSTFDIYSEIVSPIVMAAMEGFNGTVFAYGQTASGKTFTMFGDDNMPGIVPVAVDDIFNTIENNPEREYVTSVQYMEIYNENVSDLLSDSAKSLDIREDMNGNIFVRGLKDEFLSTSTQAMDVIKRGEKKRHFAATNMNERSSRSHTLFRITIGSRKRCEDPAKSEEQPVTVAHLNLVDLAGSEKANQTGATGMRLVEGGNINRSLLTLSQVICQLSENSGFVSYRDSKLTRILQNALGGNSKTAIICNVTPASVEETHSTLKFATRAKRVKNKPVLNEVLSEAAMLAKYKTEVEKLQKQLHLVTNQDMDLENKELKEQLKEMERQKKEQEENLHNLRKFFFSSSKAEQVTKVKEKRRQTWYAGKTRMSVAPLSMRRTMDSPGKPAAGHVFAIPEVPCSAGMSSGRNKFPRRAQLSFVSDLDDTMENTLDNLAMQDETFGTSNSLKSELEAAMDNGSCASSGESSPESYGNAKLVEALRLEIEQKDVKIRELLEIYELQSAEMEQMEHRVTRLSISHKQSTAEKTTPSDPCEGCKNLQELEEKLSQYWLQDSERAKKEEELEAKMAVLTKENEDLLRTLEAKEEEIMELKDLREFEKEEVDFKNESMFNRQLESELSSEMESHKLEMKNLLQKLEESQKELEETRNQLANAKPETPEDSPREDESELHSLRDQIAELQRELESSKASQSDAKDVEGTVSVSEYEKQQELHDIEVADLRGQIAQLRLELEEGRECSRAIDMGDNEANLDALTLAHESEVKSLQAQIADLNRKLQDAQKQIEDAKSSNTANMDAVTLAHESELKSLQDQIAELDRKLQDAEERIESANTVDEKVDTDALIAKAVNEEKRRATAEMQEKLATVRREAMTKVADEQNALLADLKKEENENKQLLQKYTKAKNDADLAEHQMKKAEEEKEALRSEMHTMHSLLMDHEKQAKVMENNPEKLMDRFKKMATNLDLTTQRCQKYEAKMKEFKGIEDKADELTFQRNNLQRQLREAECELKKSKDDLGKLRQANVTYQSQVSQFKLQVDLLQDNIETLKADKVQAEHNLEDVMKQGKSQTEDKKQLEADLENKWLQKLKEEKSKIEKEFAAQERELKEQFEAEKERLEKEVESVQKDMKKDQLESRERLKEVESALERKWREKMEDERNAMLRELASKEEELMEESKKEKEEMKKMMDELEREKMKQVQQVTNSQKQKEMEEELDNKLEEERRKIEEDRLKIEEEQMKLQEGQMKVEEVIKKFEEEKTRFKEEKMKFEEAQVKFDEELKKTEDRTGDDQKKTEEEQMKFDEEKMKIEEERKRMEEERMKFQEEQMKFEQEKSNLEEEQLKLEEEKLNIEDEQMKIEEERTKFEEEQMKIEEERKKLEQERIELEQELARKEAEMKQENEKEREEIKKIMDELEKEVNSRATAKVAGTTTDSKESENDSEQGLAEKLEEERTILKEEFENQRREILEENDKEKENMQVQLKEIQEELEKRFTEIQFSKEQLEEENAALKECIDMAQSEITELKNTLIKLTEEHETTLLMLHSPRRSSDHLHLRLREAEQTINSLTAKEDELEKNLKFVSRDQERLRQVCEEHELSLAKKDKEIEMLKGEIGNNGSEDVQPLKKKISQLEEFLQVEKEERDRLRNVCDEFAVDLDKNEAEIKRLTKEVEDKDAAIQQLREQSEQSRLNNTKSEDDTPKEDSAKLQARITQLEAFLEEEKKEAVRLRDVSDDFAADLDKYEAEIKKLKKDISEKEEENKRINELLQCEQSNKQSSEEVVKLQEEVRELKEFLQSETSEREKLRDVCDNFATDLERNETEIEELRAEVERKNVEVLSLKEELNKPKAESADPAEVKNLQDKVAQLELFLAEEKSEVARLRDVSDDFAADLDKHEAEIKRLKATNEEKDSEIKKLKEQLEAAGDTKTSNEESTKLQERIKFLEMSFKCASEEEARLRNACDEYDKDLDKLEAEIKHLKASNEEKDSEIKKLKEQPAATGDSQTSDEESAKLQKRIEFLEMSVKVKSEEEDRLRNVCDEFANELDQNETEIKRLQSEIAEKNSEITKLKGDKDPTTKGKEDQLSQNEISKLKAKMNGLEENLELERRERERLRKMSEKYSEEINKNELEIDRLRSEVEMKESEIMRLRGAGASAVSQEFNDQEFAKMREKIRSGTIMYKEKEKEAEQWERRYIALKKDREQLYDTLQEKKAEITKLQHIIDDNEMDASELTAEERQRGLKQSFARIKMQHGSLQAAYREQVEAIEEKKKEYRAIIQQLRKEVKELKEDALKKPAAGASEPEGVQVSESFNNFLKSLGDGGYMARLDFAEDSKADSKASSIEEQNAVMRTRLKKCYETIRYKEKKIEELEGMFASMRRDREGLYDTLQEKKKEMAKLQHIIDDHGMDCEELTEAERAKGLKHCFVRLKMEYECLDSAYKKQTTEHEEKRKEYRGIIGGLRREIKELKESKGLPARTALSEIQNTDQDEGASECKQQ